MCATVLDMSMSLDGFIAGPNERLAMAWATAASGCTSGLCRDRATTEKPRRSAGVNGGVFDELMSTGAVVAGRRTFEPAGLGRRPPRRRADLHPLPPGARNRY